MRKLYIILFISFVGQQLMGQTKVFTLDLSQPKPTSFSAKPNALINGDSCYVNFGKDGAKQKCIRGLRARSRDLLSFELKNANPYKYRYELNSEVFDFFADEQASFTKTIDQAQGKKEENSIEPKQDVERDEGKTTQEKLIIEAEKNIERLNTQKQLLQQDIVNNQEELEGLAQVEESIFTTTGLSKTAENSRSEIMSHILSKEKELKHLETIIEEEQKKLDAARNKINSLRKINKEFKAKIAAVEKEIASLEKKSNTLNYEAARIRVLVKTNELVTLKEALNVYISELASEDYMDLTYFLNQRKTFKEEVDLISKEMNDYTLTIGKKLSKTGVEKYNELVNSVYKKALNELTIIITQLFTLKKRNFTLPIEFDGKNIDVVQLKLTRTPRVDNSLKSDTHTYNIWVTGGFKIDVSAGVFLSSVSDREYTTTTISEEVDGEMKDFQLINEKNLGSWDYGFGTLANVSWRTGNWARPTLSFGAMFTNDQKFQFLAGGGLILGKMSRFILHYGVAVGRTTSLQTPFKADGETRYESLTSETIPTVEKLNIGSFFGITYNLGKTKTESTN